ncbi:MAG TPA: AraC family transcriptional regulator, partial [Ramlibacter sp.]
RLAPSFGRRDPLLAQLVNVVLASLEDSTALHPAFGETMATCIAVHLVEHYADTPASRAHTWALSARQLRRLTDYVQAHLAAPCEVARLAAEVGLSAAHFSRCFKATCGVTPHQFVTRLKMEHARTLLLDGGLPVADVGQAVGFTSRAHFAQVFRRHWGAAPAALRRQA